METSVFNKFARGLPAGIFCFLIVHLAMLKLFLFSWLFVLGYNVSAQKADSTKSVKYSDWSEPVFAPRIGLGNEGATYVELGIAKLQFAPKLPLPVAQAYYAALTWAPSDPQTNPRNVFGLKAGYELDYIILGLALEGKYQTDGQTNNFVITPKAGISIIECVNFYYGLNIPVGRSPFSNFSHNQFSVVLNLTNKLFK